MATSEVGLEAVPSIAPQPAAPKGWLQRLAWLIPRRKTEAELAEERARRQELLQQKEMQQKLSEEAQAYAWQIRNTLEDLNVCYRYPKSKDDFFSSSVKQISFVVDYRVHLGPIKLFAHNIYGLTEEAIYLPVDLGPRVRPRGVGVQDLMDENVLQNLSVNVGRKVHYWCNEADGFGYIVWRTEGINAVAAHVKYDDILASRPASADSLSIPLGEASGKRKVWHSLGQMVSILVAGTTNGGKSNFLNVLIATLVNANSPTRLRMGLIDLKRGVEFTPWLGLPHILNFKFEKDEKPAVIDRREEVIPFLTWAVRQGETRLDMIREAGVKNIGQYNSKHPRNVVPRVVIVIDEWADIKLDPKIGPAAQELLINVASRFRAAGFSVIVCTQYPQKEVVSMRLKAVLPAKLAFAMPNIHASIMVLNNSDAFGFHHPGRAIFQWGQEQLELQVPLINNDMVEDVARKAKSGEQYKAMLNSKHDVTDEEVLEWAITENNGKLDWRSMYAQFRGRGFRQMDAKNFPTNIGEQIVIIGASSYVVSRPPALGEPWRLLPIDDKPLEDNKPPEAASPQVIFTPDLASFQPDEAQLAETLTDADMDENTGLDGRDQGNELDVEPEPDRDTSEEETCGDVVDA